MLREFWASPHWWFVAFHVEHSITTVAQEPLIFLVTSLALPASLAIIATPNVSMLFGQVPQIVVGAHCVCGSVAHIAFEKLILVLFEWLLAGVSINVAGVVSFCDAVLDARCVRVPQSFMVFRQGDLFPLDLP